MVPWLLERLGACVWNSQSFCWFDINICQVSQTLPTPGTRSTVDTLVEHEMKLDIKCQMFECSLNVCSMLCKLLRAGKGGGAIRCPEVLSCFHVKGQLKPFHNRWVDLIQQCCRRTGGGCWLFYIKNKIKNLTFFVRNEKCIQRNSPCAASNPKANVTTRTVTLSTLIALMFLDRGMYIAKAKLNKQQVDMWASIRLVFLKIVSWTVYNRLAAEG